MNITELARQLKITTDELKDTLPRIGFDIGRKAIKVDDRLIPKIKVAFYEHKKQLALEQVLARRQESGAPKEVVEARVIELPTVVSVHDMAQKMKIPVSKLISELIKNGVMASLSDRIDFETASIVAEDLGFKATHEVEDEEVVGLSVKDMMDKNREQGASESKRAPVVVVVGHVDHGKTTLLDAIRKTNVVAKEAGGITQHIGAYQVVVQDRAITFLDTPGHEAFKAMRARGSKIADVAIVVVAADDGLKPQTLESLQMVQSEGLAFLVAINKVDKPDADVERVKKELAEINLAPEDWGGKTVCVEISAKQGLGIESLLEHVLLLADLKELKGNYGGDPIGTIIEAHINPNQGPIATVLVHSGTLKVGDTVQVGEVFGKIKGMYSWDGKEVETAGPSTPVKILGLKGTPLVGDVLEGGKDLRDFRGMKTKSHRLLSVTKSLSQHKPKQEETQEGAPKDKVLKLIIRADVVGSLEALTDALNKLEVPGASIDIASAGLGSITESDLGLAETLGAHILGFSVDMTQGTKILSRSSAVEIKISRVIYELIEYAQEHARLLVPKVQQEVRVGQFKVTVFFKKIGSKYIVGGVVEDGHLESKTKFQLMRGGVAVGLGDINEVQINKQIVEKAPMGSQAGINVSCSKDPEVGDVLEVFKLV